MDKVSLIFKEIPFMSAKDFDENPANFFFNFSSELVGLHCTHGVNRSGYVLARYLIEWLNFEPEKAIEGMYSLALLKLFSLIMLLLNRIVCRLHNLSPRVLATWLLREEKC